MCGDGLTDLVRIRNGEVCYWPNLGYGRFGAKVTMDNAPWFDNPDQFDQRRIRLADIDGSGTTDIIYLGRDGVRLYFNQSGNRWSEPRRLTQFPPVDNLSSVMTADLLGNGTACLVWSSPLPGDARRPLRYIDLMGGQKPHLLIRSVNNLGAETSVRLRALDQVLSGRQAAGKPWITRLPFPVHVVERVETYDRISGNPLRHPLRLPPRLLRRRRARVPRLRHGGAVGHRGVRRAQRERRFPAGDQHRRSLRTCRRCSPGHGSTPACISVAITVSDFFAGLLDAEDEGEYYREPGLDDDCRRETLLLDDTVLPAGLTVEEEREACRALKGSMLRQEVYALDGTDKARTSLHASPSRTSRSGCCSREATIATPCSSPTRAKPSATTTSATRPIRASRHALTLEVDEFGNVLKAARHRLRPTREPIPTLPAADRDQADQTLTVHLTPENERHATADRDAHVRSIPRRPAAVRDAHLRADRARRGLAGPAVQPLRRNRPDDSARAHSRSAY